MYFKFYLKYFFESAESLIKSKVSEDKKNGKK